MKTANLGATAFLITLIVVGFELNVMAQGQSQEARDSIATLTSTGSSVRWAVKTSAHSGATLTVTAPDGRVFRSELKAGATPQFNITDKEGNRLPDGQYTYELRLSPELSKATIDALKAARGKDDDKESVRATRKRAALTDPSLVQSGDFSIVNGSLVIPGAYEEPGTQPSAQVMEQPRLPLASGVSFRKVRRHHLSPMFMPDQVIPDDLIVQGSGCFGFDCVNGEVFGVDTVRLKENNTRLHFDDTSTSAGFATNNWQIRANDQPSGGASFLAFVDQGATGSSETISFRVDAGAPANSLKVSSVGKVGVRTATPVLDVHITSSDTPAHRLEQTNAGGFSAQTWDVAGNEANFFVRDVTSGSLLPFRIRPGAPTSSIDISAAGLVGVGTASPASKIHGVVSSNNTSVTSIPAESVGLFLTNSDTTANNLSTIALGNSAPAGQAVIGVVNIGSTGSAGGHLFFNTRAAGGSLAERMRITSAGLVGIGTNAPTDTLSVNGTASKTGGGSWAVFSDERLKNIKGNFNSGLKAVMQLQPVRYEYKRDNALGLNSAGEHIGFGAHELQKIIPEAVSTTSDGYLQVNNDPIIWTMLNAIKEQQKEIEQLKGEIRKLQAASRKRR
ncbi:MAG TPA: tail fiber domain-containing protein [Pyrinomonadaceae bacterium]|nr:tail fiber domain-containing protein [Pyrinomonadaceae bacterium]